MGVDVDDLDDLLAMYMLMLAVYLVLHGARAFSMPVVVETGQCSTTLGLSIPEPSSR